MKLIEALSYEPVELSFGTSGLRGLVTDMTDLECYLNASAFLDFLGGADSLTAGETVYVAGDLRDSTPRILASVVQAIRDKGCEPVHCGLIPTPNLALYARERKAPCIMVTGSHIPADRNGIKFYKREGEVLKADETPIKQKVAAKRKTLYSQDAEESIFTDQGMLRESVDVPEPLTEPAKLYIDRFVSLFDKPLADKHIVVYQHSAVGRDMLCTVLEGLGAKVTPVGRSESFIPIDTENVTEENKAYFRELTAEYPDAFAIVSTDGDSDRPFVIDEAGTFHRGDVVGCLVAEDLHAGFVATPISSNDAVDVFCEEHDIESEHTKIGSPFVIVAMQEAADRHEVVVGWEVNGGFLTGSEVPFGSGKLSALPTRDAFFPILSVLTRAVRDGKKISELFARLPARFTGGGLLDLTDETIGPFRTMDASQPETKEQIMRIFQETSLGAPQDINAIDGIRMRFGHDVVHLRASGNAPQLRVYTNSDSQERADELAREATKPGGILEHFAAAMQANQ